MISQPLQLSPEQSKCMAHRYKFLIFVRWYIPLTEGSVMTVFAHLAGIIEGANDGRGRGRQGMPYRCVILLTCYKLTNCFQSLLVRKNYV